MIDQDEATRSAEERGRKKQRESKRRWASEEGGKLGPWGGGQPDTGGAAEAAEAGVHWCVWVRFRVQVTGN